MTKTIKINAVVAPVLMILGVIFKTYHWPGANVLLLVGCASAILLFVLLNTSFTGKLSSGFERFNVIIASLAIIIAMLATVFKLMHWPGAGNLIWAADISFLITGILFLIDGLLEKDPTRWILKFITVFFILILLLVLFLVK